ncbi:YbgC/FadM family acyl-CoA thioesterase [Komagataeibacter diospyri]|uniref:4-hydroxybenzoyl-CoA thioesterase n=1 Tax=Komagataeibacter diospyri TaxID=1932662 RepID=A0A4P5NPV4_9PROT|nr:YbgC/FadM family acyl-CoA thioesterase [Komagataeibacter diospyri]GCE83670.1 4-hydroxybenzoyl-CoA thioesterase [Komagataeibacter diospyri]GCE90570.1 4-hydroxybenzoyl-CoA thioesterase [Komagataeibacter diospyri]
MVEHNIDFRIYYEDTDAGGVVYHARYLALAERARTEAIRAQGQAASDLLADYGLAFVVRHAAIDYRAPLRLDDIVRITTRLTELGAASCRLMQDFHRVDGAGDLGCGSLDVRLACVRAQDGRAARFPPRWRDLLRELVA